MAEGFDYAAYRRMNSGGNPDRALLVTWRYEARKRSDGTFDNVVYINIFIDKDNQVDRPATEEDKERFSESYKAWLEYGEVPQEGTPIVMCAFAMPSDIATCKAEKIYTLEQLAETPDESLQSPKLIEFKYRAIDYLKGQENAGYAGELRAKIDEQAKEIAMLKERLGGMPERPQNVDEIVTCPHCLKEGKEGPAMRRWHFDNCKKK